MHLARATSSRFVCDTCRNVSAAAASTANGFTLSLRSTNSSRRAFSSGVLRRNDHHELSTDGPAFLDDSLKSVATITYSPARTSSSTESSVVPAPAESSPPPPSQAASIPWYLRQQSSTSTPSQNPAPIPDLPTNPPPLLASLLEYVSVTAGLDDLQLLDLRHLDPPPALGPKLIMLIATARSEKHLHVSADRFCRYLRKEHGLKAHAAGLLGRNELKIKLRRKAKRMRMLANVGGAIPEGNLDDGIRTGWICCTLDKIEAHPDDTHMPGDNVQEFVGFRDIKPGVNIVVQMFTEEKRTETDLETLWGGVLRTHQRRELSADEALAELDQDLQELQEGFDGDEDDDIETPKIATQRKGSERHTTHSDPQPDPIRDSAPSKQYHRPRASPGDFFPPALNSNASRQLRRLHTIGFR